MMIFFIIPTGARSVSAPALLRGGGMSCAEGVSGEGEVVAAAFSPKFPPGGKNYMW